jgi:Ca2+-transporting ATPase
LALAVEPPEAGIMSRPPRDPGAAILDSSTYTRLGRQSAVMTGAGMAAYLYGMARYGSGVQARTLGFLTLTSAQLLHALNARTANEAAPNPTMRYALLASFGLLAASQIIPGLTSLLGATRIGAIDAMVCIASAYGSFLGNRAARQPGMERKVFLEKEVHDANLQRNH